MTDINSKKIKNFMIDLETLSTKSNAVICSVGIIEFNIETGQNISSFYQVVDIQSCIDLGMNVEGDVIKWWFSQTEQARLELCKESKPLQVVLKLINDYMGTDYNNNIVWSNGSCFDITILENAFEKCKLISPWVFRNIRDVRTVVSLLPQIKNSMQFQGIKHHPLDDCKNQIEYLVNTLNHIVEN